GGEEDEPDGRTPEQIQLAQIFFAATVTFLCLRSPIRHWVDPGSRHFARQRIQEGECHWNMDHHLRVGSPRPREYGLPEENVSLCAGNPTQCLARILVRAKVKI